MEYDVFARIHRGDSLLHIGTVEAPNDELAQVYAEYVYDEEDWVEMCVVPRPSIRWVRRPKGILGKEEVQIDG
ncbi:hypothetical protein [Effusibacillus pohliae]|uniref:hypothetical protein n=1 Tax=Effusibacillus pohliae TaxID=232270 RepID=UPI0003815610|nr:hypothetical protein [Effusibacillus pohliae]